jgi:hypothetical protein
MLDVDESKNRTGIMSTKGPLQSNPTAPAIFLVLRRTIQYNAFQNWPPIHGEMLFGMLATLTCFLLFNIVEMLILIAKPFMSHTTGGGAIAAIIVDVLYSKRCFCTQPQLFVVVYSILLCTLLCGYNKSSIII